MEEKLNILSLLINFKKSDDSFVEKDGKICKSGILETLSYNHVLFDLLKMKTLVSWLRKF